MGEHSFSRQHRFTGLAAFTPVLRAGRRIRSTDLTVAVLAGSPAGSRFGVVIPKRTAPKATTRNRMKRVAREVFRRHPARNAGLDVVLLATRAYERALSRQWGGAVHALLDRAIA